MRGMSHRFRRFLLLGKWLTMVLASAALAVAGESFAAAQQPLPTFEVQLAFREGRLVVDAERSTLRLGAQSAVFEGCPGLTPQAMHAQLVQRLDGFYADFGTIFERLAVPEARDAAAAEQRAATLARLRTLAQTDETTRRLLSASGSWTEIKAALRAWRGAHANDQLPVFNAPPELDDLYLNARTMAGLIGSPLLPAERDRSAAPTPAEFEGGRIDFVLSPPLVDTGRLQPVANEAQWSAVRGSLGEDALKDLRCRLWNREPTLDAMQDYLALRGQDAAAYRAERDAADRLGVADSPPQLPPEHHAGISPERTRFADVIPGQVPTFGGRVLLMPDPLVRTVFIQTGPNDSGGGNREQAPWKALYLLLSSADYARVRGESGRYLCSTVAVWKAEVSGQTRPAAVRLDLESAPGRSLDFAGLYLSQHELAVRLQRLVAIGQRAGINFTRQIAKIRHRDTVLIIDPLPEAEEADLEPPAARAAEGRDASAWIPVCPETPNPGAAAAQTTVAASNLAQPLSDDETPGGLDTRGRRTLDSPAPKPKRHEVQVSIEKPAGKPASLGVLYSHQGLLPSDHFSMGFGHQREHSGEVRYNSDFVAFDTLQRRLQLSVAVTRTPLPDRPNGTGRNDELRDSAELAATLDLWRDRGGTFGQSRLALVRTRVTPVGAEQALPEVSTLRLETTVAAQRRLTAAAPYSEGKLMLGRGRAAGAGFGLGSLDVRHQRFVGAFERIDLHLAAAGVGRRTPSSEWLPFGGEDTVRGWRNETVLTRRSVALQAEYWMRMPWMPKSEALERLFRRELALALFVDVGRVSPQPFSTTDARRNFGGAGAGVRYTTAAATPVTMKLDLARPMSLGGPALTDEGRLRVHFSVSIQQSL